jgi:spore germination protein YaaH
LATGLHADQRGLAVYSMRRTTADDSAVGTGARAYDWAVLARAADLLLVSGYNESPASRPGPVSTTNGFQAVVGYAASVARANVVPLVAQYGYWWPTASGGTRTLLATQDAETERLTQGLAGTPSDGAMSYVRPDGSVVWYETAGGAAARVRQAQASGMAWWGLFSMGREPDAFWSSIP